MSFVSRSLPAADREEEVSDAEARALAERLEWRAKKNASAYQPIQEKPATMRCAREWFEAMRRAVEFGHEVPATERKNDEKEK